MGDLELRARARDAAALDSPEARARVLVERLRAGTLTAERVGLAAYCGSPEADAIIDLIPQAWRYDLIRRQFSLGGWVRGLVRWGPEVQVRAAVSSALLVLATPGRLSRAADEHAWRVLEEAHTWLADPCAEHRLAWGRAFVAARPQDRGVWGAFLPAPYARPEEVPTDEAARVFNVWNARAVEAAGELTSEAEVRAAVQRSLITWALS